MLAAKLLADAAAKSGFHVQSFSAYGAERRGGKVESYVRISKDPIQIRSKMYEPECVIIMDETLAMDPTIISGLKESGWILINSARSGDTFSALGDPEINTVDANRIAADNGVLLPNGMPVINTTLLGAFVGMIPELEIDSLLKAIEECGIPQADKNVSAAEEAYQKTLSEGAVDISHRELPLEIITKRYPYYRDKMPPCQANCPTGHSIHKTISLIRENRFEEALENIRDAIQSYLETVDDLSKDTEFRYVEVR